MIAADFRSVPDPGPRLEELELLRELARAVAYLPINIETAAARRELVIAEPPRWRPDQAFARRVGDPERAR